VTESGAFELPLFELPIVLLPGELLPLHIFEERYKSMISHCLETEEPFGIVFADDEEGARAVGCTADVAEVLQRFDDGRLNIIVSGGAPFRVVDRHQAEEFPAATVEPVDLTGEPADEDPEAAERARAAFAELAREAAENPDEVAEADVDDDAYGIAARITLPPETKQKLLETRSEGERIRILARALEAVLKAVRRSQRIAETAQSNGHARL
jgi:Lon protease-like protein